MAESTRHSCLAINPIIPEVPFSRVVYPANFPPLLPLLLIELINSVADAEAHGASGLPTSRRASRASHLKRPNTVCLRTEHVLRNCCDLVHNHGAYGRRCPDCLSPPAAGALLTSTPRSRPHPRAGVQTRPLQCSCRNHFDTLLRHKPCLAFLVCFDFTCPLRPGSNHVIC